MDSNWGMTSAEHTLALFYSFKKNNTLMNYSALISSKNNQSVML